MIILGQSWKEIPEERKTSIIDYLKEVDWKKIKFHKKNEGMFDKYTPDLGFGWFWVPKDISKDTWLQIKPSTRHVHISISPVLQKIGLGTKMIKALSKKLGWIVVARGRVVNPIVFKMVDKIKLDREFKVTENENGEIKIEFIKR